MQPLNRAPKPTAPPVARNTSQRRRTRRTRLLALTLLVLIAGCVRNPVSGRLQLSFLSQESEQELGARAAKEVEEQMGLLPASPLGDYLSAVGNDLAKHSPRKDVSYQFAVVDMAEPNAFALPGGYIYISRGLLAWMNSEDELAGVVGHEIGHVAARHAAQRYTRAAPVGMITGLGAAVTGIVSRNAASRVSQAGQGLNAALLAPHGRDQERESDAVGQQLAAETGRDPAGLSEALSAIGRHERLAGHDAPPSWLDSHPSTGERVATTRARAAELGRPSGARTNHDGFLPQLDGLLLGKNPDRGRVDDRRYVHTGHGIGVQFAEGYKLQSDNQSVVAMADDEKSLVAVTRHREGDDPKAAALALVAEARLKNAGPVEELRITGLRAARVQADDAQTLFEFTLIAHRGHTYLALCISQRSDREAARQELRAQVGSFHALTPTERGQIQVVRMRLVAALAGETLEGLGARAKSAVPTATLAAMNALEPSSVLAAGRHIKVPVREGL